MKIQKKKNWGGGGEVRGVGLGGQGGCEGRIEVFVKMQKKKLGGVGGLGGAVGLGGVRVAGVRVDVNAMLGVGGDVGYGGCEPRIEGIVQCTKGILQY